MNRPSTLWLLLFFLVFLGAGGFYGGLSMLADPSGDSLRMAEFLPLLHIPDYRLPGLFLTSVMGALPLFLIYALLAAPSWPWLARVFAWSRHHWAWTATLGLGLVLLLWLTVQAVLIGLRWPIQYITAICGVLIIALALLPSIEQYYQLDRR